MLPPRCGAKADRVSVKLRRHQSPDLSRCFVSKNEVEVNERERLRDEREIYRHIGVDWSVTGRSTESGGEWGSVV